MTPVPRPRTVAVGGRRDLVRHVDQLVRDLADQVEQLICRPAEVGFPAALLSRLQALGEIAAAVECAADQAAYWAGQAGAGYEDLARTWEITGDEARLRWYRYAREIEGEL